VTAWTDDEVLQMMWRFEALEQTAAQIGLSFGVSRSAILGMTKRVRDADAQLEVADLGDTARLVILRRVLCGTEAKVVAKDFAKRTGRKIDRLAVLLLVHQMLRETALAGPCVCADPANRDTVAFPGWWSTNVVKRRVAA
jgi:hypothetical protein